MRDAEKRKRVMARSMRLGHCICDPKKPCPCDLFREKDVCLCAGERLESPAGPVALTRLVANPGCASKIDQATLKRALRGLTFPADPRVLVGVPAGDDAGVFQLDGDLALVQTVDVFSPVVDDPYLFGQIAAVNSVSDIYAMGARPLTALSILGLPIRTVPESVMRDILRGGVDKMAEAGVAVIGGHSINDSDIKAGFAVTGLVDSRRIVRNAGAMPDDALILTKAIGTGFIAFAAQINRAAPEWLEAAARSMAALNRTAAELMLQCGVHACTDITGFGLMGHLGEMAAMSQVDVELVWDDIPLLPGILECTAEGIIPGVVERNRESSAERVVMGEGTEPVMLDVCCDAQTSGGLLVALPASKAQEYVARLRAEGVAQAASIGRVLGRGTGRILLQTKGERPIPACRGLSACVHPPAQAGDADRPLPREKESVESEQECCVKEEERQPECCAEGHRPGAPGAAETQQMFQEFMRKAGEPGALDAHAKQAITIALSVLSRCEPCARAHIQRARALGLSQQEIDEAAWLAISFGGSPVMMFYKAVKQE